MAQFVLSTLSGRAWFEKQISSFYPHTYFPYPFVNSLSIILIPCFNNYRKLLVIALESI